MIPTLQLGGLGRPIKRPATSSTLPTFDPAALGAGLALSNANRTLTKSAGSGWAAARGTVGYSTGHRHFSLLIDDNTSSGVMVGLLSGLGSLANVVGGDAQGFGYYSDGNKWNGGGGSAYGATYTTGDVITVDWNATAGDITFYKNGVSQGVAFSGISNTLFLASSLFHGGANAVTITANPVAPSTPWG